SAPHDHVEIAKRAKHRIDIGIVGHVVAVILHRRAIEWRNPDRINAKLGDVLKPLDDALKVADAIAVRVAEGARIDLIDYRAAEPISHAPRMTNDPSQIKRCSARFGAYGLD